MPAKNSRWTQLTLPVQFLLAGAVVMLIAMSIVGYWVSTSIRIIAVQNAAANAAVFVESFIAPISQELALSDHLSDSSKRALVNILEGSSLRERIVSYKIWGPDSRIIHASNPDVIGLQFWPEDGLKEALEGRVSASFKGLNGPENAAEAQLEMPLLEVYLPLRETSSNEIIAVIEFYERADELERNLFAATLQSWLMVGATFLVSGMCLFWIVQAGGRKIRSQRAQLKSQLEETRRVGEQNATLQKKAVTASARASAKAERTLRQLGADLHDGPAQYLSLAALRLENAFAAGSEQDAVKEEVREWLNRAMSEIRTLSRGLALPDLDGQKLDTLVRQAVHSQRRLNRRKNVLSIQGDVNVDIGYAQKLCVYRFLQEGLSNAARHAPEAAVSVQCRIGRKALQVIITDDGPGFDTTTALRVRAEGGQGLLGLYDRVESIGGSMSVDSRRPGGTILTIGLPIEGHEVNRGA
ncbi:sensor histidine kinase [Leisingera sp. D0M16]|uniref:sensor histidine kinase n=1 Tax=Leisingera coralii TaxID=3351347 RepID=UPI003B820298